MEVVGGNDNLGTVCGNALDGCSPLPRGFERGLNRLCTGVHGQGHLEAGQVVQIAIEQWKLIVAKGTRGERDLLGLATHGLKDSRMTMSLVNRGISGKKIEISIPFFIE
jgi:hypothetical protein